MRLDEDKPIPIPERFRASTDTADAEAYQRLLANDAEQAALRVNSPFTKASANDVQRSKALITIQALSVVKRTPEQQEQFAECWATIGRFDVAAKVSKLHKKHYKDLQKALECDGNEWCGHDKIHQYIKARYGGTDLIACNLCSFQNITERPDRLQRTQRNAAKHNGQTKGMTIQQAKQYHIDRVSK